MNEDETYIFEERLSICLDSNVPEFVAIEIAEAQVEEMRKKEVRQ